MAKFTARQISDLLSIRRSRTQMYSDKGIIVPLVSPDAPGAKRYFSERNIVEVALAMKMTSIGIGLDVVRHVIFELSEMDRMAGSGILDRGHQDHCGSVFLALSFKDSDDKAPRIDLKSRPADQTGVNFITATDYSHVILVCITEIKEEIEDCFSKM